MGRSWLGVGPLLGQSWSLLSRSRLSWHSLRPFWLDLGPSWHHFRSNLPWFLFFQARFWTRFGPIQPRARIEIVIKIVIVFVIEAVGSDPPDYPLHLVINFHFVLCMYMHRSHASIYIYIYIHTGAGRLSLFPAVMISRHQLPKSKRGINYEIMYYNII